MIGKRLRAFGAFWYDFIVGDDWRVAVGVVLALVLTYLVAHGLRGSAWWIMPVALLVLLPMTLYRQVGAVWRRRATDHRSAPPA